MRFRINNDLRKIAVYAIGEFYEIADIKDIVYIGKELPDEYTGSRYAYSLKGANTPPLGADLLRRS